MKICRGALHRTPTAPHQVEDGATLYAGRCRTCVLHGARPNAPSGLVTPAEAQAMGDRLTELGGW